MDKNYTLTVTLEDLRIIAAALNELPHRVVANLIGKLDAQVQAQERETPTVPPTLPNGEEVSQ